MTRQNSADYQARKERVRGLFVELRKNPDPRLRDEIISLHINLVEYLARKFVNRGEPFDDLLQVGFIGLIKAIDRFDLDRGVEFTTYATPTIIGEIKRHFRDKGWAIRIPRRLQMKDMELNRVVEYLNQELKRAPTIQEVAEQMGLSEEEVVEVLESAHASDYISLDSLASDNNSDRGFSLMDHIGTEDGEFSVTEYRATITRLLQHLDEREQQIIYMRFFQGLTQVEIARELGISQMHVSRLLNKMLIRLRDIAEF